jgi:amino acid adenylation domain-containing protein
MVPASFVLLDALPLTPHGKVDRRALPAPGPAEPDIDEASVEPRNELEQALAEIWRELLRLERVGVNDNFFDLGGHSLLAIQLISRVRETHRVELSVRSFFETPTLGGIAQLVEQAKNRGPERPPFKKSPTAGLKETEKPDGTPENEALVFPASFAQQRMWFLDQLEPGNAAYNMVQAARLSGRLHESALERSLNSIVRRHEILRTYFVEIEGAPAQVIGAPAYQPLNVIRLSGISDDDRESEARRLIEEEANRPFDLAQGPLFRATLIRIGAEEHILALTMHHIISDGWSIAVLYRELSALYEAFCRGSAPALPELPIQYADFAVWQRQWLQGEVLGKQLSYWKRHLSDVPVLELATDRPRPAAQTFRGAKQFSTLPKGVCDELKALSRREGATLFMTLLAAFQTLLHRYTGQEDIVVGAAIAGRIRPEVEELVGLFINTLALRGDASGNPTFREFLARTRQTALDAYEHQELPFEKLVEELNPRRDLSRSPLFQVMFGFQNLPQVPLTFTGLRISPIEVERETAKFDLTLWVHEDARALTATLGYNTDLFEHETIKRMLGHFQTLLEGIVAHPERRISELPLLTEAERRRLLIEWNDTARDYPKDKCVHELFEAQAERTPEGLAVVCDQQQLTYGELNRRANRVAHYLRKSGVQTEARVGIYLERSPEMIVALLAILKAGAAYVPLDTDYPEERIAFMLADSQARWLLTQNHFVGRLPKWNGEVVGLDPDGERFSMEPEHNPAAGATAENLAYVIYTSGSTGTPKGVAVPHRAITRLVVNSDYASLTPDDVVAQASNSSFDAATFEIWGALLNGARLAVVRKDAALSPRDLAAEIGRHRISAVFLTTALFNLAAREFPAAFKSLRHLLFGGETVDPKCVAEILRHGPPERLLHVYGPTETTTFASWYRVNSVADEAATVPIGRPIANTEIYLLDRYLNPVPIGVVGEIYIGGDGLAQGYLNHPGLTAEKFIRHPFSDDPQARLYKSGDLGRYLADGNIEFLGRVDDQIKIRGFRVEPGEIENVLGQNAAVRQALVMVREDSPAGKYLVAYVVPSREPAPTAPELRNFLKQSLPAYMIPAVFVVLERFPLTPNGKVDRQALPLPSEMPPDSQAGYAPPTGVIEQELARIWEELLPVRPIGAEDSFFDLGGHSLLAVQMVRRIEQECGERIPLTTVLAGPTIKHLAEALRKQRIGDDRSLLVKVQSGGAKRPLFFLHGDFSRGGFYCLSLARRLGEDRPFYALAPHGLNGTSVPETVEEMAASYLDMIRAVQPEGPYVLGGYCNGGTVAFEIAQQLLRQGQRVELVVLVAVSGQRSFHKRLAHRLTHGIGNLLGFGSEEKLRLFLGLRAGVRFIRRHYRRALGITHSERADYHFTRLYTRTLSGYLLKSYPGRVALFWPSDLGPCERALRKWQRTAPQAEIQAVPGNHFSCISRHPEALGDCIKTCLEPAADKE